MRKFALSSGATDNSLWGGVFVAALIVVTTFFCVYEEHRKIRPIAAAVPEDATPERGIKPPVITPFQFPPKAGTFLILPYAATDGDTVKFYWLIEDSARLNGLNAPEIHSSNAEDRALAKKAKEMLATFVGKPVRADIYGREKYGRALLDLYNADGQNVAQLLIQAGVAKPWDGKGERP